MPRWLEVPLAAAGLVVTLPALVVAVIAVRVSSPGPVLFRQLRVGRGGRPFELVKFRSMRTNAKRFEVTSGDDPLITGVGRVLRRTKIDELPSLWNVVRGDMSLVGPRPEVPALVDLNDELWEVVLAVRPGLTDPVTLSLRNEEVLLAQARARVGDVESYYRQLQRWKLRGYAAYLRRRSVWTDLWVVVQTTLTIAGVKRAVSPSLADVESANDLAASAPGEGP